MKILQMVLITIILLITTTAIAEKKTTIGAGVYTLNISYGYSTTMDDDFAGAGISVFHAFNERFAARWGYYETDHRADSSVELKGFDLSGYIGTNLNDNGFKAYIGGGVFKETLYYTETRYQKNFSGIQVNGGIGYNWKHVALDFVVGVRDPRDYEKYVLRTFDINTNARVLTNSLILSARF